MEEKAVQEVDMQAILDSAPLVHNYDRVTKVWLSSERADLDPLEFEQNDVVCWLVPANATLTPPPAYDPETQVAVYNGNGWDVVLKAALPQDDAPVPVDLAAQVAAFCQRVDRDVDAIIFREIGNRAVEYLMAEQQALAYKATGYNGDPPDSVVSDMVAFGRSAVEATDAMLEQAQIWRRTLSYLRAQRLKAKQDALKAANVEDLAVIAQQWLAAIGGGA